MAKPPAPAPTATQTGQAVERLAAARLPYHPMVGERFNVTAAQWKVLVETTFPAARTVEAVCMAIAYCQTRKLDIFKKPIHIVPMWSSQAGGYIETVWPGISELRTTAMRTGEYMGTDEARFGETISVVFKGQVKEGGGWKAEEAKLSIPEWCQITVYRGIHGHRVPFPGPRVYWLESYAKRGRPMEGFPQLPNEMWVQRKIGQLEKVAEAAALRKAFPEEVGSEYSADEMAGQVYESVATPAAAEVVTAPVAPTARPAAENYRPKEETKPAPAPVVEEPTFLLKDAEGLSIDEYDIEAYTEAYGRRIDQAVLVDAATVEAFIAHNRDTVEYLVVNRLVEPLDWFETVHAEVRVTVAAKAPAVGPGPAPAVIDVEDEGGVDEDDGGATPVDAGEPPVDDAPPAEKRRDWTIAMPLRKDKSPNTTTWATAFRRALAEAATAADVADLSADNAEVLATLPANWASTLRSEAETRRAALA